MTNEDFGFSMDENTIKNGLRGLNSDIHFDMGAALSLDHPFIGDRQGVFYKGKHICSMDRGTIPEYTMYSVRRMAHSVPPENVRPGEGWAPDLKNKGKVVVVREGRGRVIRVGWRHTFERLINANIPGVTRFTLAQKFKVPIKFLTGERETVEVAACL
jgi:hypothetical protein